VATRGPAASEKRKRRARRSSAIVRWSIVGMLAFVAYLYYRPLASYFETRAAVAERRAEVAELRREKQRLAARLAQSSSLKALEREARCIGYVRPGEKLFIVKGVSGCGSRAGTLAAGG
jgi:cell division protein FtsB